MAKTSTLIKRWTFTEDERKLTTFSDPSVVRLNPSTQRLELTPGPTGYPLTPGVVTTGLFMPTSVKQWLLFEALVKQGCIGGTVVTSVRYRVTDGVHTYVWNGTTWTTTVGTTWNTDLDLANHIASLNPVAKAIGFLIQLSTSDARVTPKVAELKLCWASRVTDFLEDLMIRTLVPSLRGVGYIADFAYKVPIPGGYNLDVGKAVKQDVAPFNLQGCDSIFNHTADPGHDADLLSSFNATTGIATLTAPIPVGNQAFIKAIVEPMIALHETSPDFIEIDKVPAVIITDFEAVDSQPLANDDHVANRDTGAAIVVPPPYRFDVRFNMLMIAPGTQDLIRLTEAVVEFMDKNQLLKSGALDKSYRLQMIDEFKTGTNPNLNDVTQSSGTFMIYDVCSYRKPARAGTAIMRFNPRVAPSPPVNSQP